MLVGDIITQVRELINDLPRGLFSSGVAAAAAVVAAGGSTLPTGTYYVKIAIVNSWGELLITNEVGPLVVGANQGIQVTAPAIATVPGATLVKAYFGIGSTGENQWASSATLPFTISAPGNPGVPNTRNTSFYPDSDGQRINAYSIYRWLNESLEEASKVVGGIPDSTGFPSINGNTSYQLNGLWNKLDHGWYDGYPFELGGRNSLFNRNKVAGYVSLGILQQISDRIIIELQPQPNRSGATTTLNGAFSATATSLTVNSVAGFLLPFGLLILGTPPSIEIVSYSTISGAVLSGIIRGYGGTAQQLWPDTTPVAEANVHLTGLRVFTNPTYAVGDSAKTLAIPGGWRTPLIDFMVARFRQAEGNSREAQRLMTNFNVTLQATARGNKLVAGPRQIGGPSDLSQGIVNAGGFRTIIP